MYKTNNHGLPKPLLLIIQQLFANNTLKSWNVYSNKYEQLVLSVKFDLSEPVSEIQDQTCLFRRVSNKQQSRNIARAANHNKKRKINPTSPEGARNIVDNISYTNIDSPELVKQVNMDTTYNSIQAVPGEVKIDPPSAAPVTKDIEDEYQVDTEYKSGETYQGSSSTPSVSKELCSSSILLSPVISDVSLPSCIPIIDPLTTVKQDAMCQIACKSQNVSTQVEQSQRNQITQCRVKTKLKSTQTQMVNFSEESTQAAPDPIICVDSAVQYECQYADKSIETLPIKIASYEAPRYDKTLGYPVGFCKTFCYLTGYKLFDRKGHSDQHYYRCENCGKYICDVCNDWVSDYHWASCCKKCKLDGALYSSNLSPKS